MSEDQSLDQPSPDNGNALTDQERAFVVQALSAGVNLQGNFESLVPTMNLIQSIIRKLSSNVA